MKDNKGQIVTSMREYYEKSKVKETTASKVFGTETDTSSDWISVEGPIKGSFVVKIGEDYYNDYLSDFGFKVEDPCQAVDDRNSIHISPARTTVKDLKYQNGTDSYFWLANVC